MNKFLTSMMALFCMVVTPYSNLTAYTFDTLDSTTVTQDWPSIYQLLVNKEYDEFRSALIADQTLAKSNAPNGYSLLEFAILTKAPNEVLQTILVFGADVNKLRWLYVEQGWLDYSGHSGSASFRVMEIRTPLFAAISIDDNEIIQLLLNYGADINFVFCKVTAIDDHNDGFSSGRETEYLWSSLWELLDTKAEVDAVK